MTLGEQITALRKEKKLSQEELALAMEVSRQAVSKWENGITNPDTENLVRLARVLEVDVNVLIGCQLKPETEAPEPPPDQRKTVRLLSILLAVAVCAAAVFGTLWLTERSSHAKTLEALEPADESRWDSVKLYRYTAGVKTEISLDENERAALVSLVWNYRYVPKVVMDSEKVYGGIHVELVCEKDGVCYCWKYRPEAIYCTVTLIDGYSLEYEYEMEQQFLSYLSIYLK